MDKKQKERPGILSNLRCVVCCSGEIHSEIYIFKRVEKSVFYRMFNKSGNLRITLEIPTCTTCRKQFHKWRSYNLWSNGIYLLGLVTVGLGIFFLIFHQFMEDTGVLLLGVGFLIVICGLILRYIIGKINSNPSNYFFYDFLSRNFYIKPKGESDWILYEIWLKNFLSENKEKLHR